MYHTVVPGWAGSEPGFNGEPDSKPKMNIESVHIQARKHLGLMLDLQFMLQDISSKIIREI